MFQKTAARCGTDGEHQLSWLVCRIGLAMPLHLAMKKGGGGPVFCCIFQRVMTQAAISGFSKTSDSSLSSTLFQKALRI